MIDLALVVLLGLKSNKFSFPNTSLTQPSETAQTLAQATTESEEPVITEVRQFRFEFAGCEPTQNAQSPYRCNFLIENIGRETAPLTIRGRSNRRTSYIVDAQGIRYSANMADVAGHRRRYAGWTDAAPGVPIRASIFLEEVPVAEVSYIELYCNSNRSPGQRFSATFGL